MSIYIASWCNEGFEYIEDISKYEYWGQEQLVNLLADKPIQRDPLQILVRNLQLRAQFNPQRHYEIYSFNVDKNITELDVKELARQNPQYLVDWIRKHGNKLYSDRSTQKPVII